MPDQLCHSQGTACVARGWLDPQPLERSVSQHSSVSDTVEGHAAGQAQVLKTGLPMCRPRHAQHDLLADDLNRARQVHLPLRQLRFRHTGRATEQAIEGSVRHREAREVIEVLLVQGERAVLAEVDQLSIDHIHVLGLAVRRKAHHLVFARIDLEPGVIGEGGVQQAKRVGPMQLPK